MEIQGIISRERVGRNVTEGFLQTKDARLCIYACDFFSVTPEMIGEVDAVYDRGALEAINVSDRPGYVKLMHQLIGKDFR